MRIAALSFVLLGIVDFGCYKPDYAANPDAQMAFRCHKSDTPACPVGLACCKDGICGDALADSDEGWCIPPLPPVDMTITPIDFWPFPAKTNYYSGVYAPLPLTGYDEHNQWRCTRDDTNEKPSDAVLHMLEPNDFPAQAIVLPNPLPKDLPPSEPGSPYQICPDKTAPDAPDVDVYKFGLSAKGRVIAKIKYELVKGDLDLFVFRKDNDPETGKPRLTLIGQDTSAADDGCVELTDLKALQPSEAYYVVVRGAPLSPEQRNKFTMNNYNLKVFLVDTSGQSCKPKDMGP